MKQFAFFIILCLLTIPIITYAQVTDTFEGTELNAIWTFYNGGDSNCSITVSGGNAEIDAPLPVAHNLWTTGNNNAPRLLQPVPDIDFTIEVKFESTPINHYQMQGIIIQENNSKFLRFGTYYGTEPMLFCAAINGGSTTGIANNILSSIPHFLRVERSGNNWTYYYSDDGTNWSNITSFPTPSVLGTFEIATAGFYAGNADDSYAFTSVVDYFWNTWQYFAFENKKINKN